MSQKRVTVFGGTGFLGQYVVQHLIEAGYAVQVIARRADKCRHLRPLAAKGQLVLRNADVTLPKTFQGSLRGSYAVINLIGILYESGKQRFTTLHGQCPERLAQMAANEGVEKFVHLSALGVDQASRSMYASTKLTGEKAVKAAFPKATILRPSVIFGPGDNFFNQFARMASLSPALPLIGGGETKFQPVYAGDVAKAVVASIEQRAAQGHTFELGGPEVLTFRDILQYILKHTKKKRCLVALPWGIASLGATFAQLLPKPPLTRDQVKLLKYDNVVDPQHEGFEQLGLQPTAIDSIVPYYLRRYQVGASSYEPFTANAS